MDTCETVIVEWAGWPGTVLTHFRKSFNNYMNIIYTLQLFMLYTSIDLRIVIGALVTLNDDRMVESFCLYVL